MFTIGMTSPLVGISAVNSLLFAAYSRFKHWQISDGETRHLPIPNIAIAGAGAGAVNSILAAPVELLKVRMQNQYSRIASRYTSPIACACELIRVDGFARGLFRGFWATVWREIPGYAGFYAGFEVALRYLTQSDVEDAMPNVRKLMMAGACGGISYWTCCYPLDMIKSKTQNSTARLEKTYVLKMAKEIWREEGWRGFFRGFNPALLRSLPAAAATFSTYEIVQRNL